MKQLKGVLFDFNGTLFFDSDMHMEAFRRAFPQYGQPVPSDEFMIGRCFGRTNDTIYRENFKPDPSSRESVNVRRGLPGIRAVVIYHIFL